MAKPAILAVDDDAAVVAAVVRDLRQRYGRDYRVLRATSGPEALEILADQLLKDRPVAPGPPWKRVSPVKTQPRSSA